MRITSVLTYGIIFCLVSGDAGATVCDSDVIKIVSSARTKIVMQSGHVFDLSPEHAVIPSAWQPGLKVAVCGVDPRTAPVPWRGDVVRIQDFKIYAHVFAALVK